jgi:BirA family biotin operon repressor/biotin-[acetyl-CoA-carboxylase] ligase
VKGTAAALNEERLRDRLRGEPFVRSLLVLDSAGSTNDVVRELAAEGAPEGTVVLADRQTAGRGRMGRVWHSPRGVGLFISVLFRPERPTQEVTRWTLGAAVAACEACRRSTEAEVEIEWPNDLVWRERKIGGVLAELRSTGGRASDLVVGTGLNVGHRASDFPEGLSSRATSLRQAGGGDVPERELLAAQYLRELAGIARDLGRGEWAGVARRWERVARGASGRRVRVATPGGRGESYEGVTAGIDDSGALLVRRSGGSVASVRLAESVLTLEA